MRVAPYNHGCSDQPRSIRAYPRFRSRMFRHFVRLLEVPTQRSLEDQYAAPTACCCAGSTRSGIRRDSIGEHSRLAARKDGAYSSGVSSCVRFGIVAVRQTCDCQCQPIMIVPTSDTITTMRPRIGRSRREHAAPISTSSVALLSGESSRDRLIHAAMITPTTTDRSEDRDASESASGIPSHQAQRASI